MAADIFTKHFVNEEKWVAACKLIGIVSPKKWRIVSEQKQSKAIKDKAKTVKQPTACPAPISSRRRADFSKIIPAPFIVAMANLVVAASSSGSAPPPQSWPAASESKCTVMPQTLGDIIAHSRELVRIAAHQPTSSPTGEMLGSGPSPVCLRKGWQQVLVSLPAALDFAGGASLLANADDQEFLGSILGQIAAFGGHCIH